MWHHLKRAIRRLFGRRIVVVVRATDPDAWLRDLDARLNADLWPDRRSPTNPMGNN